MSNLSVPLKYGAPAQEGLTKLLDIVMAALVLWGLMMVAHLGKVEIDGHCQDGGMGQIYRFPNQAYC